jgi:hypothetical protein
VAASQLEKLPDLLWVEKSLWRRHYWQVALATLPMWIGAVAVGVSYPGVDWVSTWVAFPAFLVGCALSVYTVGRLYRSKAWRRLRKSTYFGI